MLNRIEHKKIVSNYIGMCYLLKHMCCYMMLQVGDTQKSKTNRRKQMRSKHKAPVYGTYTSVVAYMLMYLMILRTQYQVS